MSALEPSYRELVSQAVERHDLTVERERWEDNGSVKIELRTDGCNRKKDDDDN